MCNIEHNNKNFFVFIVPSYAVVLKEPLQGALERVCKVKISNIKSMVILKNIKIYVNRLIGMSTKIAILQ